MLLSMCDQTYQVLARKELRKKEKYMESGKQGMTKAKKMYLNTQNKGKERKKSKKGNVSRHLE